MPQQGFQKATKARSKLRCALFGPAGSGKTMSALRIATGMGGRIALIDTERGSASLYADRYNFDVLDLEDRSIDSYVAAFALAAGGGYDILIIDSLSHAWQELLAQVNRLANSSRFKGNTWAAWSEGTPKQRALVDALLSYPGHIIATIRTKTQWDVQKDEQSGKVSPVRIGLVPEQGKGIEYEFALLMQIDTDHAVTVIKDRTGRYQGKSIDLPDEDLGRELVAWLAEGVEPKPEAPYAPGIPVPADAPPPATSTPPAPPQEKWLNFDVLRPLMAELRVTDETRAKWCAHYGVQHLGQLNQGQVDAIAAALIAKAAESNTPPPSTPPPIDMTRLRALVEEHGITEEQVAKWCAHFKVEQISQLTQHQVDAIVGKIEATISSPQPQGAY